ncbi:MAG: hypothetical protein QOH39_2480 [Verrucomicrobiota bacterium]
MTEPIYRTNGTYLGFISNGFIFSRDGQYLGWIDGQHAWDAAGRFRGQRWNKKYIILNRFAVQPLPKHPRGTPATPALPDPPPNISPIAPPTGWVDGF